MLNCRKVAVTGGVGCGKSSVCRILASHGAYVVDADACGHRLMSPDTKIGQDIQQLLGSDVVMGGQFDREKIAQRVFTHPTLLKGLERILHPAIREDINQQYQKVLEQGSFPLFIAEVALLYEAGWEGDFDCVVAVVSRDELCRQRYEAKSHRGVADYENRLKRQMLPKEKAARADFVIENNDGWDALSQAVDRLYSRLLQQNSGDSHLLPLI